MHRLCSALSFTATAGPVADAVTRGHARDLARREVFHRAYWNTELVRTYAHNSVIHSSVIAQSGSNIAFYEVADPSGRVSPHRRIQPKRLGAFARYLKGRGVSPLVVLNKLVCVWLKSLNEQPRRCETNMTGE